MREVNKIASSLFDKIRSRVDTVSLGDENAKDTKILNKPDSLILFLSKMVLTLGMLLLA